MSENMQHEARPAPRKVAATWRSLDEKRGVEPKVPAAPDAEAKVGGDTVQLGLKKPAKKAEAEGSVGRRAFMKVGTATAALLGAQGCLRRPVEHILPYTQGPEYTQPGIPLHYATSVSHQGEAIGLLVESHEGRPTKVEGNRDHPSSRGATDAMLQASILDLYDPERSNTVLRRQGEEVSDASWSAFDSWWREKAESLESGAGLRVLMAPTDSPSMLRARDALLERFPEAKVVTWSPIDDEETREGARLAFGAPYRIHTDYARAKVILSLDSDFLSAEAGSLVNQNRFAAGRRLERPEDGDNMNRLYIVEGTFTVTGMAADHRLRLRSGDVDRYLRALAKELSRSSAVTLPPDVVSALGDVSTDGIPEAWIAEVAADLVAHRGASALVVGRRQPARVHALAHAINVALGNIGRTVVAAPPGDDLERIPMAELTADMSSGAVDTLVMLGGNPVYDAPADAGFGQALAQVANSIHLASHVDETSSASTWHLPLAHFLESWGDHRTSFGLVSIQQPLLAPLCGGRSEAEVLGMIGGIRGWRGYHLVRNTLRGLTPAGSDTAAFSRIWRQSLHRGLFTGVRPSRPTNPPLRNASVAQALRDRAAPAAEGWEVVFAASSQTWDGRHANNGWLLEMPEPVTKLVWDNAAWISPTSAADLGVETGDMLTLSREGVDDLSIPAFVLPGHGDNVLTLPLGFGRSVVGQTGTGVGFDVYPFRTAADAGFAGGVTVQPGSGTYELVHTQEHHSMTPRVTAFGNDIVFPERPIAIYTTLDHYREQPNFAQWAEPTPSVQPLWEQEDYSQPQMPAQGGELLTLVPKFRRPAADASPRYKWGMAIDLNTCNGCGACIISCQAENNVATVGKRQVALGREMHWVRLDRYFTGDDENNPQVVIQPVSCQHCEEAPCENVCPVAATVHDQEGINGMAYNRCIGTRYCMNNCPYKVRRFNFLDYHGYHTVPEMRRMAFNPNVTVRMRGVMEKCTFCIQRIQAARVEARTRTARNLQREFDSGETRPDWQANEERIGGNDIAPACSQACAADAIAFGDLNQEDSRVAQMSNLDRGYKLLASVGAQPRVTYLGKVRNVNPRMEA